MHHLVVNVVEGQWISACGEKLPDRPGCAGAVCPDCTFMVKADQDLPADMSTTTGKTAWWRRETRDQA